MFDFIPRFPDCSPVMQGIGLGIFCPSRVSAPAMERVPQVSEATSQDDMANDTQFYSIVLEDDQGDDDDKQGPAPDQSESPEGPLEASSSTSSSWSRRTFASTSPASSMTSRSLYSISDLDDEDDEALNEWVDRLLNASVTEFFSLFSAEDYVNFTDEILQLAAAIFDEPVDDYLEDIMREYGVDPPAGEGAPRDGGGLAVSGSNSGSAPGQAPQVTVVRMPQFGFALARDWSRVTEAVSRGEFVVIVPEDAALVADLGARVADAISGRPSTAADSEEGEYSGRGMKRKAMDDDDDDEDIKPTIFPNGDVAAASPLPGREAKRLKRSHSVGPFSAGAGPSVSNSLQRNVRPCAPAPSRIPRYRDLQRARPVVRLPSPEVKVKIESPSECIPPTPIAPPPPIAGPSAKRGRDSDTFEEEVAPSTKKMQMSSRCSKIPRLRQN